MTFEELQHLILEWANDRKILQHSTPTAQFIKAVSEMGELADGVNKKQLDVVQDSVGDVLVCLINFCALANIDLVECLEGAYNEIKDRKGYLNEAGVFIKE